MPPLPPTIGGSRSGRLPCGRSPARLPPYGRPLFEDPEPRTPFAGGGVAAANQSRERHVTLGRLHSAFRATALVWAVAAGLLLTGLAAAQEAQEREQERAGLDVESAYRRQPMLLERALSGLQATRAGQPPQLFFVSFAGWGP